MRLLYFVLSLIVTCALLYLLSTAQGSIPPLGKFLSPFTGFWQNAGENYGADNIQLPGLTDEVNVHYDGRRVPHIIAQNDHDLYYMQGYITAKDRLWEMDFITYVASGRLAELFGNKPKVIDFDRITRRTGLPYSAEVAAEQIDQAPETKAFMQAYSDGANAYINSLSYADYPVEYKLLGYAPENWSVQKSALLLKFMSLNLAGRDYDFEYTNAFNLFGKEVFDQLYPDFPVGTDPIVPIGTPFNFDTLSVDTHQVVIPEGLFAESPYGEPREKNIGSNNWAVAGNRTVTGKPMLAGDPHLQLYLPSIWYEMQLTSPTVNVYGATLPGSPNIIIGFNDKVAWSVTNAGRDVRDWYSITYTDESRTQYLFDGKEMPIELRVETIKVKGADDILDTVRYTHFGPVAYDVDYKQYNNPTPLALRWTAHDPSNEVFAFYKLNRATNYQDYLKALDNYECPAQNFVFAAQDGDIALRQQGKFPLKYPDQGKFIQDGSSSDYQWQGYIPFSENAGTLNPERGFVSSANQQPTDSTYPYFYHGPTFEYNRSRRLNELLASDSSITKEDMMQFQNDNYFYTAKDLLPTILNTIEGSGNLDGFQKKAFDELSQWDYMYDTELRAPVIFELIWDELQSNLWDEFSPKDSTALQRPNDYTTVDFVLNRPEHELMDIKSTPMKENVTDVILLSFKNACTELKQWELNHGNKPAEWYKYKNTTVAHWIPLLKPFHTPMVKVGGSKHILNANTPTHGASWRMVVSLEEPVKAWGVFPGGESGNPGSKHYNEFIDTWAAGEYYEFHFIHQGTQPDSSIFEKQTYTR